MYLDKLRVTKVSLETCFTVVDLGEGQGRPSFWVRQKKSLAQGLDPSLFYKLKRFIVFFFLNLTEIMFSFHAGA